MSIGASPEALAAAGVDANAAAAILERLEDAEQSILSLMAAREAASSAADVIVELRDRIRTEGDSAELLDQLATAELSLDNANRSIIEGVNILWTAVLSGLDETTATRLVSYRAAAERGVPNTFKICSPEGISWDAVETALIAESRAVRSGCEVASDAATVLANVRGNPAVIAAEQRYDGLLATLRTTFEGQ